LLSGKNEKGRGWVEILALCCTVEIFFAYFLQGWQKVRYAAGKNFFQQIRS
jgi:hypothetical protein